MCGLFPANTVNDDDIEVYADDAHQEVTATFHNLRQQTKRPKNVYTCLSDFIAPKASGIQDYIGAFVVTAGLDMEPLLAEFRANHDDYQDIMFKALADRLAEAFAEYLHEQVRKVLWAYTPNETLDNNALIKMKYQGIRPAHGYPACPEHTEKTILFNLLKAEEKVSVGLTDSLAMNPAASVSGLYFAHPEAQYFGLGKIDNDQVADYAQRKGMSIDDAKRWLMPNLLG